MPDRSGCPGIPVKRRRAIASAAALRGIATAQSARRPAHRFADATGILPFASSIPPQGGYAWQALTQQCGDLEITTSVGQSLRTFVWSGRRLPPSKRRCTQGAAVLAKQPRQSQGISRARDPAWRRGCLDPRRPLAGHRRSEGQDARSVRESVGRTPCRLSGRDASQGAAAPNSPTLTQQ